ncbi:histidine kinase dimerization/phospho-acceptor domain-containing protein [Sphingobacterium corticis]|uniref:histidine kinase n=1 Tax=Sphingobacterium corticis TaxID=1812823 RepID=A0ABW5NL60_9SPHI
MSNNELVLLNILHRSNHPAMLYISRDLEVGFANEGMAEILGNQTILVGKRFVDIVTDTLNVGLNTLLQEVWDRKRNYRVNAYPIYLELDGDVVTKYLDWYLQPVLNDAGDTEAMFHYVEEVVESKSSTSLDQKMRSQNRALSHDLRNPLSVIKLGMQYIQSRPNMTADDQKKWVSMVADAVQSMEKLIADKLGNNSTVNKGNSSAEASKQQSAIQKIYEYNTSCKEIKPSQLRVGKIAPLKISEAFFKKIFSLSIQSALNIGTLYATNDTEIVVNSSTKNDFIVYDIMTNARIPGDDQPIALKTLNRLMQEYGGEAKFLNTSSNTSSIFLLFKN